MSKHPAAHKGSITRRLHILHQKSQKTTPSKDKKGVRVKQKKLSPFDILKILTPKK